MCGEDKIPATHSLAYSLLEQDVIGGLPCVAYSTSSNPWEADYCSLWVTQHAIQSATARSSPALCKMALAGRSPQSALADLQLLTN